MSRRLLEVLLVSALVLLVLMVGIAAYLRIQQLNQADKPVEPTPIVEPAEADSDGIDQDAYEAAPLPMAPGYGPSTPDLDEPLVFSGTFELVNGPCDSVGILHTSSGDILIVSTVPLFERDGHNVTIETNQPLFCDEAGEDQLLIVINEDATGMSAPPVLPGDIKDHVLTPEKLGYEYVGTGELSLMGYQQPPDFDRSYELALTKGPADTPSFYLPMRIDDWNCAISRDFIDVEVEVYGVPTEGAFLACWIRRTDGLGESIIRTCLQPDGTLNRPNCN